jgi:hypothetical protein
MPKDPTRNMPNYKIGGDHLNEYEFEKNKGEITYEEKHPEEQSVQTNDEINENGFSQNELKNRENKKEPL